MSTKFVRGGLFASLWITMVTSVYTRSEEGRGPTFVNEPPGEVTFLNNYGYVIPCSATGNPSPTISWRKENGTPVENIPGLRHVRWDGSLDFPPFSPQEYRKDVHFAVYRCIASNSIGTVGTRNIHVQAVIRQPFEVGVSDGLVAEGNTAVLRCRVPTAVKDYVKVSAWLTDEGMTLLSDGETVHPGSKYQAFTSGMLHISNVDKADGDRRYRCQVENRLTGEKVVSSVWGRLKVTEALGRAPPKIIQEPSIWETKEGRTARIPCVAHGNPQPSYSWYKEIAGQLVPITLHQTFRVIDGTLIIEKVSTSHAGKYVCAANNSLGEERADKEFIVRSPLKAEIISSRKVVRSGEEVILSCSITGPSVSSVVWVKDQRPLPIDHRMKRPSATQLHISGFQREDSGMYQCYVYNDKESAQAQIQIDLQEELPVFLRTFPEQIHMPGHFVPLQCVATGSPLPRLTWTLDGGPLPEGRRIKHGDYVHDDGSIVSYVNISDLTIPDGGLYGCQARNDVGVVSHFARVDVYGVPFIRPVSNTTVMAGKAVTLRCPVSGYPIERIIIEKGGHRLPYGDRQTTEQKGAIRIHNARKDDEGYYKCTAINTRGERAERQLSLYVVTAPVISPFMFADNLEEGMRSSPVCSVIAGDPPVKISWYKDGWPIHETSPDIQIVSITDFVSSLIINNVGRHHSGNYTCIASNSAASVNYTARMVVRAPPRWLIKPTDQTALTGMPVTFDCQAEGEPRPVVRWKYTKDSQQFHSILSSSHIHVLENGSLIITAAQKSDVKQYLCETSNDVGEPLRQVVRLAVHSAPQIQTATQVVHVRVSEKAVFSCSATGDSPLSITWSRDDFALTLYPENRYTTRETETREMKISEVTIVSAQRIDSDTFICTASNPFGEDKTTVRVIVQEPPDPPKDVRPIEINSTSVSLSWTPGYPGNSPITSYVVSCKADKDKWMEDRSGRIVVSSSDTSATITGLQPVTTYQVEVFARNAIGQSNASDPVTITTTSEPPRRPPRQVKAIPLDSSSIKITWQMPTFMDRYHTVEGFYVGYKEVGNPGPYVYKTVHTKDSREMDVEYILTNLRRSTKYSVVIQAFNSQGAGPSSDEVVVQTYMTDPPPSPALRVVATTATSIHVKWEIALSSEKPVTGFILRYKDATGQWRESQLPPNRYSYTLESLQCGTPYHLVLVAFNGVGRGQPSESLQIRTDGKAPVSPPKNIFIRTNSTFVVLTLRSWEDDGCPISHFVVQYKPQTQREWILVSNHILLEQETVVIADLSPGTWHDLLVTAHSDAGTTEAEYRFATLTLFGVPPLTASKHPYFFEDPTILVPIICAVVVLVVIISVTAFVVVWKRRESGGEASSDLYSRNSGGRADDISMSSYGKAKGNSVYDSQREPLYYPLPYATTHIPTSQTEPRSLAESPECLQHRGRIPEHTYDVPHRVQGQHTRPPSQYSRLWTHSRELGEKLTPLEAGEFVFVLILDDVHDPFVSSLPISEKYHALAFSQESDPEGFHRHPDDMRHTPCYETSLDGEELSETECDRDRRRSICPLPGDFAHSGSVIVC